MKLDKVFYSGEPDSTPMISRYNGIVLLTEMIEDVRQQCRLNACTSVVTELVRARNKRRLLRARRCVNEESHGSKIFKLSTGHLVETVSLYSMPD